MSRVLWDLIIHDMSPSFVAGLGALQTRKFKEWNHFAKHGNATVFYRSAEHFGLKMNDGTILQKNAAHQMPFAQNLE